MKEFCKTHLDALFAAGGLFAAVTMNQINVFIAFLIGFGTLIFVTCKAGIWAIKFRMSWRNRNNTKFWVKKDDDEETET